MEVNIDKENLDNDEAPYIKLYGKENDVKLNKHFVPIDIMEY